MLEHTDFNNPHMIQMEVATQLRLALRDGLDPSTLTEEERKIFTDTFGLNELEFYEKYDNSTDN